LAHPFQQGAAAMPAFGGRCGPPQRACKVENTLKGYKKAFTIFSLFFLPNESVAGVGERLRNANIAVHFRRKG